jgi:hypothetical protein
LDGKLDEVSIPKPIPFASKAIEIRGDSLGGLFDRWLLFYDEIHTPPTVELCDRLCVVGLQDESVWVKKLHDTANLDGIPIVWAAPVKQLVQKITK